MLSGRLGEPLADREEQILLMLAEGYENADIATELCLSTETVKTWMKSLLMKMGARNRTHAVVSPGPADPEGRGVIVAVAFLAGAAVSVFGAFRFLRWLFEGEILEGPSR